MNRPQIPPPATIIRGNPLYGQAARAIRPLFLGILALAALAVSALAQTTAITTTGNAPARLTVTGTQVLDVADGVTYTFDHLATGTSSAIHLATAGAVFRTTGGGTTVFISNTTSGAGRGAAVRISASGTLDLQNVIFGDPASPALGNTNNNYGGALYASNTGFLKLRNASFYDNTATSGAAVAIETGASSDIANAVFLSSTASTLGGAILYNSTANSILASATFGVQGDPSRGNTANNRGGALVVYAAGTVAMTDVAFFGNKTTTATANQGGGAIHITAAGRATINGAVFEQNSSIAGGALQTFSTGTTTITSATFGNASDLSRGNSADAAGGAIDQQAGHLVLTDVAFYNNSTGTTANANGGAINVAGTGTLTINGALFASNSTTFTNRDGGAILFGAGAVATFTSATFSNNNSARYGGAIVINNPAAATARDYTFTDSRFSGNTSASNGGAIWLSGQAASGTNRSTFTRVTFSGNTSGGQGGALYARGANVWLTLDDAIFTDNITNGGQGGAIALPEGGLLDYNSTITATHSGNLASTSGTFGGFLYLATSATANFNIASDATVQIGGVSGTHDSISTGTFADTVININNTPGNAGTLVLADGDSSAQRGAINVQAGRLLLAGSAKLGGDITVASGAVFGGQGALASAAGGDLNKTLSIQTGGTLQVGLDGVVGTAQILSNTGTITLAHNSAIIGSGQITGAGAITLGATVGDTVTVFADRLGADDQWVHIANVISGDGAIVKTGSGILGLAGANTFSGGVRVEAGMLRINNTAALGTGTLSVTGTGVRVMGVNAASAIPNTIALSHTTWFGVPGNPATFSGTIVGPGAIVMEGGNLTFSGTLVNIPALHLTAGRLTAPSASSVPLVSLSNTAAYAGDLARVSGQTLSVTTGSIAGNLTLSQGAGLEFDLAAAGSGASLALSGTVAASGTTTINLLNLDNATYTIISAGSVTAGAANFAYTVNGGALTGRNSIAATFTSTDITLAASYRNLRMSWTGANGGTWDTFASNWSDAATSAYGETHFVNGDSVRFTAAASGTVAIAAAGVTAGDIEVASTGALTFTGGSITASAAAASVDGVAGGVSLGSSGTVAATGKLVKKGAGTLIFDNAAGSFAGGLDIEGGTLAFNRAAQLGDASGTVSFTGPATLRADGDILGSTGTLAGTLALAAASGTLDTQGFTVESAAVLAGSGTLVKTGAGKLILRTIDNSAFAAPAAVNAGSLLLAGGAKLGGPLTVAPGATAGGAGAFTGAVTVSNAALLVGAADNAASASGTLAIGGPLTLTGTTRVQFAIHAGGAADILNVTGAVTTATASNIVALSFGVIGSGTYALGNAAALAAVKNLEVNGVLVDDSLRIVSELAAASGTLLYIYGADDSRYMEWTGASGTARWNIGLANWQGYNGDTGGKTKFQDGDTVRFTGAASASIALDSAVTVSDLLVDNTGTLAFTGAALTADTAVNGALITGAAGKLVKNGAGALIFDNSANTFSGGVALNAGLVSISSAAQLNTAGAGLALASGTLRALGALAFSDTFTLWSADGPSASVPAIDTGPHAVTLSGGIAGTGTLAKLGAGALTLSAATAGENLLAATAVTRVVDGAVLLRDFSPAAAAATAHTFILDGGFLDLSVTPGFNGATGTNALDWTNLRVTGTGGAVIGSNDKLTLRDGDTLASIGGTTTAQQGLFVVVDAGAGGTATLTGSNNYAGRTLLQSGTLRINDNTRLGLLSLNREVRFTGSGAALEITGDGFVSNRPLALDENGVLSVAPGATTTWTGSITGAGKTLAKAGAGTLVLTNTGNSASLSYHVAEGVLETTPAALAARAVTADAGGTLALNLATSATHTPNLTGAGAFEKRGAGVLTLAAALGNTGAVRVAAGTLKAGANNQFSATSPLLVAPGATLDL
ncbi:beta strand repeat-containing protein, partial [Termitidicoccus mucosus]